MQKVKRSKTASQDIYEISEPRQYRALRSALRQEVVDAMESMPPCTIAMLAERLGRPPESLYFHVRALERVGLVKEVGQQGSGRERAALYALPGRRLRLRYAADSAARVREVGPVADSLLRLARRDVRRGLAHEETAVEGPGRELWVLRARGWLTKKQREQVNRHLASIADVISGGKERPGTRAIALAFALTPIDR